MPKTSDESPDNDYNAGIRDPPLALREFYRGKTLLCTGCSGFLGKVLVEKILRCVPEVKKVYLLIRPKGKSTDIAARMKKEILDSPIMDLLRQQHGKDGFYKYAFSKLEAVAGDVAVSSFLTDNGSVKKEDVIAKLRKEVQVVIHSAATIGFHERLDVAIGMNVYGACNAVKFAKSCEKIEAFAHISTAYVNSNYKSGTKIHERQYPLILPGNEDVEDFCQRVTSMKPEEIEKLSDKYLNHFGFPNTYTFTKRMGEMLVVRHAAGIVPVAIIRPSIVGGALKEPFPGWVDTVSAGGSVYLFVGLGVVSILPGDSRCVSDQVPVDMVANAMLVCPADVATNPPQSRVRTYHAGSSYSNPGTWQQCVSGVVNYWRMHPSSKAIAPAEFNMITSSWYYNTQFFMQYTWISRLYSIMATWNKSHGKIAQALTKMENKANLFKKSFGHFCLNEWFFENLNMERAYHRMDQEEKDIFFLDMRIINWDTYFSWFCYGLHKWILKEDPPLPVTTNVVSMVSDKYSSNLASDLNFVYTQSGEFSKSAAMNRLEMMKSVMESYLVQNEIQKEAERKSLSVPDVEQRARLIMETMFADPNHRVVRGLSWFLRKVWRQMYQSVNIESEQISMLRQLATMGNETNTISTQEGHIEGFDPRSLSAPPGPLVFIPTHRSYMDFLIISYIFFAYSIPVPHIAAGEDFLNMSIIKNIFRHSGAFFIRRQFGTDPLYKAIFTMYVQHLLMDGCPMEFFVEGTRSRSGKTLHPKLGLLSIIIDSFLERKVPNLTIVPVNISYERVIEGQAYSSELLGEAKKKESLQNLIKARNVLKNRYGDIHVKIAPPISLVDYVKQLQHENAHVTETVTEEEETNTDRAFDPFLNNTDRKTLVRRLAYKITHELHESSIVPATALVAAIVLAYRDGISVDELNLRTAWLRRLIIERGGRVSWVAGDLKSGSSARHSQQTFSTSAVVERALSLMNDVVVKRKFMVEPAVNSRDQHKRFIQLGVYRNQIIHLFVQESIMACAYEQQAALIEHERSKSHRDVPSVTTENLTPHVRTETHVNVTKLLESARYLSQLMKFEFVRQENPDAREDWETVLQNMVTRGIFQHAEGDNQTVTLPLKSFDIHRFLCSLLWPFIESYWAATMAMLSLLFTGSEKENLNSVEENVLIQRIQWLTEKLYFEGKVHYYESCSLDTIKNAVSAFVSMQVLARTTKDVQDRSKKAKKQTGETPTVTSVHLLQPYTEMDKLFGLVQSVQEYRKVSKTMNDVVGEQAILDPRTKSSFPFSSRL